MHAHVAATYADPRRRLIVMPTLGFAQTKQFFCDQNTQLLAFLGSVVFLSESPRMTRAQLSKPLLVTLASSAVVLAAWRLMQWRARKRLLNTVERVNDLLREGPLVSHRLL
jgi:hypothetical protein